MHALYIIMAKALKKRFEDNVLIQYFMHFT